MARWSLPIKRWADATGGDLEKATRAAALDIFRSILIKSPVDTGRFRGNWMISLSVPIEAVTYDGGPKGQGDANSAAATAASLARIEALSGFRLGQTIHFRNTLPYAVKLEKGWSDQAPLGVVRVTLREAGALSRAAFLKARRDG